MAEDNSLSVKKGRCTKGILAALAGLREATSNLDNWEGASLKRLMCLQMRLTGIKPVIKERKIWKQKKMVTGGTMGSESNILQDHHSIWEAILIPVGTRVELEVDGIATKLKSFCVGALPEECLIFKYPSITNLDAAISKLSEGKKITVRYADRGNVFAFQSELLGFVTAPVKLIFVAYPATIVRHSLRKVQRVDYPLFAEVEINNEQFEGLIKDISARGCRLSIIASSSSQALPIIKVEQMLSVRCTLPGMETEIVISGQVKSLHQEDQRVTIGTVFHDIDPEVSSSLASFISSIQKVI